VEVEEFTTTVAPAAANRRAVAAPIPEDEPVMRTVCPRKAASRAVGEGGRGADMGRVYDCVP
jgi:hypothetical protein